MRTTNSQKDIDIAASLGHWMKQIQDAGGKAFFQDYIDGDQKSFIVAWCTAFQLRVSVGRPPLSQILPLFFVSFFAIIDRLWSRIG